MISMAVNFIDSYISFRNKVQKKCVIQFLLSYNYLVCHQTLRVLVSAASSGSWFLRSRGNGNVSLCLRQSL